MKKLNAGTIRKLGSILLLAGITGTFLSVYYFIYLPRQQVQFNSQTFRVLNNIAVNFTERVSNFGISRRNARITKNFPDTKISRDKFKSDTTEFKKAFYASFNKSINQVDSFFVKRKIIGDSVEYTINSNKKEKGDVKYDTVERRAIKDFLEPLTSIYKKIFPAVYLVQQRLDIDSSGRKMFKLDEVLFSTAETEYSIANINTDSLFGDLSLQVPVVVLTRIDDVPIRMFLFPFKMMGVSDDTYVLAGLMENENYNRHVQNMPVILLATVIFLIIIVLLSLPFLKIFLLSANESVHLSDIRSLIAVIFIIPFFMILGAATIWIYADRNLAVNEQLESLHSRITKSFFTEIDRSIRQQLRYDSIADFPYYFFEDSIFNNRSKKTSDLKDDILYPRIYRHFTNLHWMSPDGKDIAVWNLRNPNATYFDVRDRSYFQEIRRNRGRYLPKSVDSSFVDSSYSIQPILSRLTGEYTISIATKSYASFDTLFPAVIGISSKMYSVYNPILPEGYSFCIIDSTGLVQCHPDTARSLQENIFKESTNNYALRTAVNHKESAYISNVVLHDQDVKMLVKPMPGLPYYLITYYQERKTNLFVFHVAGFALVSQLLLFLMASLLSYFILLSRKKIGKLSFVPHRLNWLKPTANKRNYYLKNALQLILTFSLVGLLSLFHQRDSFDIYFLNVAILLPLFVVTSYYLIKESKNYADRKGLKKFEKSGNYWGYIKSSWNILLFYVIAITIYILLQNHLFFFPQCPGVGGVKVSVWILILAMPVIATRVAASSFGPSWAPRYLHCFILSLLLAVTMVSIVPAIALLNFGYREEIKLQVQSAQIDLSRKIQQRRPVVNTLMWQSKLDTTYDRAFFNRMKFDSNYGIYLTKNDQFETEEKFVRNKSDLISCSPFFQIVTQFLFLPPEHDEFYNARSHEDYYRWTASLNRNTENVISLSYNNISDPRSKLSFTINTKVGHFYLFHQLGKTPAGKLIIVIGVLFFFAFYKLIASTTTRIFLLDYFSTTENESDTDAEWLIRRYGDYSCQPAMKILGFDAKESFNMANLRKKEMILMQTDDKAEEKILKVQLALHPLFEKIWNSLTSVEQYTLFDFATDGFTNYKKMGVLYGLFNKGLLVTEAESGDSGTGNLIFMSMAFRNYVLGKGTTEEIRQQAKENKSGSWSSLRMVLIVVLIAFAVFIFATQQEATQRIITILTSLGTLLPLMLKLFDTSSTGATTKK